MTHNLKNPRHRLKGRSDSRLAGFSGRPYTFLAIVAQLPELVTESTRDRPLGGEFLGSSSIAGGSVVPARCGATINRK
jgi:hypothetical protein